MNREEFDLMKKEFGDFIYRYEWFLKNGFLADLKYNTVFYDYINEVAKIHSETQLIANCLSIPAIKVKEEIEKYKNEIASQMKREEEKHEYAKLIIGNYDKETLERKKEMEKLFHDFALNYHPIVTINRNTEMKDVFQTLRKLYNENNLDAFKLLFEESKKGFEAPVIEEKDFNDVQRAYMQMKNNLAQTMNNLVKKYPYTKTDVFKDNDEMRIKAEEGEIIAARSKEIKANKEARAKYKEVFNKEFSLE